jgi:hypothetical protein
MRLCRAASFVMALILLTLPAVGPALGAEGGLPALSAPAAPAAPGAPAPGAAGAAGAQQRSQIGMVIESISPSAATPASKISLTGYLQNSTNQPITGITVRLRYSGRPLASRGELAQQAQQAGAGAGAPALVGETARPQQPPRPLAPGARQTWRLGTTAKELGFGTFGVYPLSVEASDAAGRLLGAQRTFLTFVPKDYKKRLKPTKIAWVWPLVDVPHRTIDNKFSDDKLSAAFAQGGRLNGLVAAARTTKTPLTWAVDPALLDDARTMAKPYTVKDAERPKSAAAERWLADVKAAVDGQSYFATPYADPDVTALVRRGRAADLKDAYSAASMEAAQTTFGRAPAPAAWPPEGATDQNTLNQLSRIGSRVFLLSSDVLPGAPSLTYTPSAAIALPTSDGTKYAVAGDRPISSVIGADTHAPGAEVLAEQRFLAETALITAERPGLQRTVLVVPPRRWNPSERFAERLLADTTAARWLQPTTLDEVTRLATGDPRGTSSTGSTGGTGGTGGTGTAAGEAPAQRTFAGYPAAYQAHELSAAYLKSVRSIQVQARRFASIFDPPLTGYDQGVLRLESSAWRGGRRAASRARAARNALRAQLTANMKQVYFVLNKGPSLAGEIGQVPVTIANDVPGHSITVHLEVTSAYPAKLQIGKFRSVVTIPPEKKVTIQIPMKAAANGKTDVRLALLSPGRRPIGVVRQMQVNATGFGRTALLITGGALVVLLLGVGVRVLRARRRDDVEDVDEPPAGAMPPGPETIAGADREARA